MTKRSLGELNGPQRIALKDWAHHMGVTEGYAVNWLNKLDDLPSHNVWGNLDTVAAAIANCESEQHNNSE